MWDILFSCLFFLILFGFSLWPLLFRESKHFKWILLGANLLYFMMAVYALSNAAKIKTKVAEAEKIFNEGLQAASRKIQKNPEELAEQCRLLLQENSDLLTEKEKLSEPLIFAEAFKQAMSGNGDSDTSQEAFAPVGREEEIQ